MNEILFVSVTIFRVEILFFDRFYNATKFLTRERYLVYGFSAEYFQLYLTFMLGIVKILSTKFFSFKFLLGILN